MSEISSRHIVDAFLDALEARDFDRAGKYLSRREFHYLGPTRSFDDAEAFVADISRIGPVLERLDRRRVFVDGDEVVAIFEVTASIPELASTRVALWARVEMARITRIEVFFDARPYASLFPA